MIKLVIFDCYGIVLNEGYPRTSQALASKYGGRWQDYQNIMYGKYFNMAATRKISQKEAWIKAVADCKLTLNWQELRDLHYSLMKLDPKAAQLNSWLNEKGITTLLLSKNTRSQFVDVSKIFGLRKIFKNIINTWELGLPKASTKTMNLILKRFNVKPSEVIYGDDQRDNLVDANKLGMKTIFAQSLAEFKKGLKKYL
ncbi:HAD hydrolase-like protein [Patescibacteria group bacterium]|nr:HAD hydrolase-like protein [Patescibacteria group bacterium]MBU1890368.1 HAD hydrolase-like protein [Patescibacteria group bacterium]